MVVPRGQQALPPPGIVSPPRIVFSWSCPEGSRHSPPLVSYRPPVSYSHGRAPRAAGTPPPWYRIAPPYRILMVVPRGQQALPPPGIVSPPRIVSTWSCLEGSRHSPPLVSYRPPVSYRHGRASRAAG